MRQRVFGLETEYGISCTVGGRRSIPTEDVARRMFRDVIAWGRSSNVFLENGARLYLDVGSHPEYATPECGDPLEAVLHERAGDRIVEDLARRTEESLAEEGLAGRVRVFRNNTDFSGNSYGSHENYLVERKGPFQPLADALLPFLVTRQVFAGAGKVLRTARGAVFVLSQRAEHIWEGVSSATTRSRPVINSRDEPHADIDRFRRLHVIVGDSNMSDFATWLRVATCELVIRLVEEGGELQVLALDSPTRAIREVSRDLSGRGGVRLADGRDVPALEVQVHYLEAVERFLERHHPDDAAAHHVAAEWRRILTTIERDPMRLERELDWVAKLRLIEALRARDGLALEDPRVAMVDLAYHDVSRASGLHHLLVREGRMVSLVEDAAVDRAMGEPPRTRAMLRGRFLRAARVADRDVTVDWVHLKLNGDLQRTVMCKDPLIWEDERVDRLIDEIAGAAADGPGLPGWQGRLYMAMPAVERLVNLTIALLETRRPMTFEQLRRRTGYYPQADPASARRMFERDKEALRALGIPIETRQDFGMEDPGYLIDRRDYELRGVDLDADEVAALALAVDLVGGSEHGALPLAKVAARAPDPAPLTAPPTRVALPVTDVDVFAPAIVDRRIVRFSYRTADGRVATRTVDPYGVVRRRRAWYLVGRDHDRDALRGFRTDRMLDDLVVLEGSGCFVVPDGLDLGAVVSGPDVTPVDVELEAGPEGAWALAARGAVDIGPGGSGTDGAGDAGTRRMRLPGVDPYRDRAWLLGLAPDAAVRAPEDLRDALRSALEAVVTTHGGDGS